MGPNRCTLLYTNTPHLLPHFLTSLACVVPLISPLCLFRLSVDPSQSRSRPSCVLGLLSGGVEVSGFCLLVDKSQFQGDLVHLDPKPHLCPVGCYDIVGNVWVCAVIALH